MNIIQLLSSYLYGDISLFYGLWNSLVNQVVSNSLNDFQIDQMIDNTSFFIMYRSLFDQHLAVSSRDMAD